MKKFITSIVAGVALMIGLSSSQAQFNVGVPSPSFITNYSFNTLIQTNIVLLSNTCKISQIQLMAGGTNFLVNFYDNNLTNTTVTNSAYTNLLGYSTNIVQTTVSGLTGVTNIYTNTMWFETNVTVGQATNQLPYRTYIAPLNTMATYPVNIITTKGIMISSSQSGTVIVTYRIND